MIFRALWTLVLLFSLTTAALAAAPLIFRDQPRDAREDSVITYLENGKILFSELPFRIAAVDLNGDGVEEWIIRQDKSSACQANAECDFAVVGLSKGSPKLLGRFNAGKVQISEYKTYGVLRLEVYNKKNNDFDYTMYVWTPEDAAFAPQQ